VRAHYPKPRSGIPRALRTREGGRPITQRFHPATGQCAQPAAEKWRGNGTKIIRDPANMPPGTFIYQYLDGLQLICYPGNKTMIHIPATRVPE